MIAAATVWQAALTADRAAKTFLWTIPVGYAKNECRSRGPARADSSVVALCDIGLTPNTVKKKLAIIAVLAALLLLLLVAAGSRFLEVFPYPMGEGQGKESPDKRFTANAFSFTDRFFWGGGRRYYQFTIEEGKRGDVRRMVIDEPPEGMIDWRYEGTIQWASDSSSVTYTFGDTQLIMQIKP